MELTVNLNVTLSLSAADKAWIVASIVAPILQAISDNQKAIAALEALKIKTDSIDPQPQPIKVNP